MAYLKNLTVSRVSFVNRAANKRQFLLRKAAEILPSTTTTTTKQSDDQDQDKNKGKGKTTRGEFTMRKEILDLLQKCVSVDKLTKTAEIVAVLKADTALKITDTEIADVEKFVPLALATFTPAALTPPAPIAAPVATTIEKDEVSASVRKELDDMKAENAILRKETNDTRDKMLKASIVEWVTKECDFLNVNTEDAATQIFELEKAGHKSAADTLRKSFQAASAAVKNSAIFAEQGSRNPGNVHGTVGETILTAVTAAQDTVKKSGVAVSPVEVIKSAIKGTKLYGQYREEHIARARRG